MYEITTDTLKQERKVILDGIQVTVTKVGAGSDFFASVIHDGTDTNEKVKAWVTATPLEVIQGAFEEMQRQFKETDQKALTDATTTPAS
jgi:hypothetical protein